MQRLNQEVKSITVKTLAGHEFILTPVKMLRIPSNMPHDWLEFQGNHIPGTALADSEMDRIQAFMKKNNTEALNDGERNVTLAGGMLALCYPCAIK